MEQSCTLTNEELIAICEKWIHKLAESGGKDWCLSVPVNFNKDPDMLFTELAERLKAATQLPSAPSVEGEMGWLKQWKESATRQLAKIFDYADNHPSIRLGGSKIDFVIDRAKKYDQLAASTPSAEEEYKGSVFQAPAPGITLGCISPEARDLLDSIMQKWEEHYRDLKETAGKDHEPTFYGFAYWLCRWSGLIQPAGAASTTKPAPSAEESDFMSFVGKHSEAGMTGKITNKELKALAAASTTQGAVAEPVKLDSNWMIGRSEERFKELEHYGWDWRSFYNGWIESKADAIQDLLKREKAASQRQAGPVLAKDQFVKLLKWLMEYYNEKGENFALVNGKWCLENEHDINDVPINEDQIWEVYNAHFLPEESTTPSKDVLSILQQINISDIDAPVFTHSDKFLAHFNYIKEKFIEIIGERDAPSKESETEKNLAFIAAVTEEGAEAWKMEYDACRSILTELVDLKNIKDLEGKTDDYNLRQPVAWVRAKRFLDKYQHVSL